MLEKPVFLQGLFLYHGAGLDQPLLDIGHVEIAA